MPTAKRKSGIAEQKKEGKASHRDAERRRRIQKHGAIRVTVHRRSWERKQRILNPTHEEQMKKMQKRVEKIEAS